MSNYKVKTRIVSLLLSLLMCVSLTACGDKEKDEPTLEQTTAASSESAETTKAKESKEDKSEKAEKKDAKESKDEKADKKQSDTSKKAENTTAKAIAPSPPAKSPQGTSSLKPVTGSTKAPTPKDSGLANNPTVVENASTVEEIANVEPEKAAQSSYDTEVEVKQVEVSTVETEEYPLLASNQFESHIKSVWSNFQVTDKVKIAASDLNEYLNYVCLPLKNSFAEINCNGYSSRYAYAPGGQYIFLEVNWSYYINASQYATCKQKAQSIVNSTSSYGSTINRIRAIHDIICKNTVYQENVDGALNCLVNGRCDCDGYTAAFQLCMDLLGVPCKAYATSNHIFNLVQMSGNWYVTDVTWDDQDSFGVALSNYFFVGKSMYTSYDLLNSMIATTDYPCSRKATIVDEAKFISVLVQNGFPDTVKVTCNEDGTFTIIDGRSYYTLSLSVS